MSLVQPTQVRREGDVGTACRDLALPEIRTSGYQWHRTYRMVADEYVRGDDHSGTAVAPGEGPPG